MITAITNGRVVDPFNGVDAVADVYIEDSHIVSRSQLESIQPDREIDASGYVVCPGLIDLKAKMGEPGTDQSTFASESSAALAGGITTVCIQPDTTPVVDTPAMAHMIGEISKHTSGVRIWPLGALTDGLRGETLTNMAALKESGCVGISNARIAIQNTLLMRRAMQYAATFDLTVFIQSHDPWLSGNGCVHEGEMSTRLGLPAIPEAAETVAVARDLALVETTGVRAHFSQLSCARSVNMVGESLSHGLDVSADVAVHNLLLTEFDVSGFNTLCHVLPPLRSQKDREGLRKGLRDKTITAICSDHTPCGVDDKLAPFSHTVPGISGLETLLPLTLQLVRENVLTMTEAIACLTCNPAKILGLKVGTLSVGAPADICIFDPDADWELKPEQMLSRGHNNPFIETKLQGKIMNTIVDGNIAYSSN